MKRFSATIILVLAALGAVSTQAEAATPVGGKDAAVADTLVNPYSVTIEDNIWPLYRYRATVDGRTAE